MAMKIHDRREVTLLSMVRFDNIVETGKANTDGSIQTKSKLIVDYDCNMNLVDKSDMMLNNIEC